MTHDEAIEQLQRIFAAHRCEDDSLISDVRALWYADVEELETQLGTLRKLVADDRETARKMREERDALRERVRLLDAAVNEGAKTIVGRYGPEYDAFRLAIEACDALSACAVPEPAPKEEPNDGNA